MLKKDQTVLLFGILLLTVLLTGCNATVTPIGQKYPPVDPGHTVVLYQEPTKPFEVIGLVSRTGDLPGFTVASVTTQCAKLAAGLGADALIITSARSYTWNSNPRVDGKAIKYK